uniref:MazG-like family protein n=1 Tax=uncultured Allobacillus sp. TaxID=1638025 RepID=UPI0025935258|nr:MazG-like family protein [uncultured Allobacillus sp.]
MNVNELTRKIEEWAFERGLTEGDPSKQVLKLGEEYGELCEAFSKERFGQAVDAIGDMYVVLTILARQMDTSLEQCVEVAYNEIKDRKGLMVNGVFVKESDLK